MNMAKKAYTYPMVTMVHLNTESLMSFSETHSNGAPANPAPARHMGGGKSEVF